jgi:hypothetical protein
MNPVPERLAELRAAAKAAAILNGDGAVSEKYFGSGIARIFPLVKLLFSKQTQGPSVLLPPQSRNNGALGDPARALITARARFTAVGMTDLKKCLRALSRRGAGRKNLGFKGANLAPGYKEDSGCPGGKKVEAGNHFRCKGRQKSPVPAQNADENCSRREIKGGVSG